MKLFKTARRRIHRKQQQRQQQRRNSTYNRRLASSQAQPTGSYQAGPDGTASYQPAATGTVEGQAKPPPPDGALASCRRCSNEVMYNGGNERWEHTGKGHAECFRRHRS